MANSFFEIIFDIIFGALFFAFWFTVILGPIILASYMSAECQNHWYWFGMFITMSSLVAFEEL